MEKGLVSILTPCYNGETYIQRYLESILAQTYSFLELILIDDGSVDDTLKIIETYRERLEKKCVRFICKTIEHGGQAKAVNYGLKFVKGEFLIWPDSDDYLSEDSIEKRVSFLKENPKYGFVRSNGKNVEFNSLKCLSRISENTNRFVEDIYMDLILEKTYCACGCYMIRTDHLFDIYPEKEIFVSQEGQNWQLLIPYAGRHKCGFIDEDHYFICIRENSHSRKKKTINEEFDRFDRLREILENTIPLANRTGYDYQKILDEKYYRMKYNISYLRGDKKLLKEYFHMLKKEKYLLKEDVLRYFELVHKNIYRIYLLYCRIVKS